MRIVLGNISLFSIFRQPESMRADAWMRLKSNRIVTPMQLRSRYHAEILEEVKER
jgi:hypothetical protein